MNILKDCLIKIINALEELNKLEKGNIPSVNILIYSSEDGSKLEFETLPFDTSNDDMKNISNEALKLTIKHLHNTNLSPVGLLSFINAWAIERKIGEELEGRPSEQPDKMSVLLVILELKDKMYLVQKNLDSGELTKIEELSYDESQKYGNSQFIFNKAIR